MALRPHALCSTRRLVRLVRLREPPARCMLTSNQGEHGVLGVLALRGVGGARLMEPHALRVCERISHVIGTGGDSRSSHALPRRDLRSRCWHHPGVCGDAGFPQVGLVVAGW